MVLLPRIELGFNAYKAFGLNHWSTGVYKDDKIHIIEQYNIKYNCCMYLKIDIIKLKQDIFMKTTMEVFMHNIN